MTTANNVLKHGKMALDSASLHITVDVLREITSVVRPHLYSQYWTGTSLHLMLMQESFHLQLELISLDDIPLLEPQLQASSKSQIVLKKSLLQPDACTTFEDMFEEEKEQYMYTA